MSSGVELIRVTLGSPFWWFGLLAYALRRDARAVHVGDLGFVLALGTFLSCVVSDAPGEAGSGLLFSFLLFASVVFGLTLPFRRPLPRLREALTRLPVWGGSSASVSP